MSESDSSLQIFNQYAYVEVFLRLQKMVDHIYLFRENWNKHGKILGKFDARAAAKG